MGSLLQIPRLKPEENWNEWFYYFQAIGDTINEVTTESESISGIASELIADIASINNDVDGINLILFNQAAQITSIISDVSNVEGDVTGLIGITGGLDSRITNNENNITALVAITGGLDSRITTNENSISFLGGISGDHETRITNNENNISGLVSISGDHETRITDNENNITALIEITGQFSTDITNNSDNITGLQTISGDHEERLDDAELSIESLSLTVQSFAGGIIDIYTNTIGITGGLDQLDERFVFLTDFIAISGDHENRITNNESDIAGLVAISGDHEGRITQNESDIAGLISISGDHEGRITTNEDSITGLVAISGDHEGRITTNEDNISGLISISGDHENRISDLETQSTGITGGLTQLDERFVNTSGDTMTGALIINGSSDTNQLKIKDHSTQTSPTILLNDSTDTEKLRIHSNYSTNLFIGKETGLNNSASSTTGDKSTFIGQEAGRALTTARNCTLIGYRAGRRINTGTDNTCVGSQAGDAITTGTGNVALGYYSLPTLTTGHRNFAMGTGALTAATTAEDNCCIGSGAGERITTSTFNLALGSLTMRYITTGGNNIAIGGNAMRDHGLNSATSNVGVGRDALRYAGGSASVAIGAYAGGGAGTTGTPSTSSLSNNVFIGYESGRYNTGSSNVFIGNNSGKNETGSSLLYIDVTDTATPLIYGDFSGRALNLNGNVGIPSDTYRLYLGADDDFSFGYDGTNLTLTSEISASDFIVDCGTEKTLVLEQPVWTDMRTPVNTIRLGGLQPPTEESYRGGMVLAFPSNANKTIYFSVQLPHEYKIGSDIEFHIHAVLPTAGAGFGVENVKIDFTYSWACINCSFPIATSVPKTIDVQTYLADTHYLMEIAETMDGSAISGVSSMILCSLTRDVTVANDYADDIYLLEVDFHYIKDTMGSRKETTK